MISCRITPRGPVIAMAYTLKVVNQENSIESCKALAKVSELLSEGRKGENSGIKSAFTGEFCVKTNVPDSLQICPPENGRQLKHITTEDDLLPLKSQSLNKTECENLQTDQSQSLEIINDEEDSLENPLPRPVTNEIKKELLPHSKPSPKSWVTAFTPDSKEHRNASKVVSKLEIRKPPKEIEMPETSQNQINGDDGWSEVKKNMRQKLNTSSKKVTRKIN